ncbi:MAG: redoxin domain-containing protein [Candidatus Lokiarchaeota archaeon]|nr:redoxin domain-containing protein [Candidatus Lokiarchaeota archaeon]
MVEPVLCVLNHWINRNGKGWIIHTMSENFEQDPEQPLHVGEEAPDFHLQASDCSEFDLSDMAGKVIVLVFLSETFSDYTEDQVHIFKKLHQALKRDNVGVVGIVTEPMATIDTFVDEENIPFRILCDFNREVVEKFGVLAEKMDGLRMVARPSVFVVDRNGTIIYRWIREEDESQPDIDKITEIARNAGGSGDWKQRNND